MRRTILTMALCALGLPAMAQGMPGNPAKRVPGQSNADFAIEHFNQSADHGNVIIRPPAPTSGRAPSEQEARAAAILEQIREAEDD